MQARMSLMNSEMIEEILLEIVKTSYDQIKNESMLLYIDKNEINILVATEYHEEFQTAIKSNFLLDEDGDIIDQEGYYKLLEDLQIEFIKMHKNCGLFDYFPAGFYEVKGVQRQQESDSLAPKGKYFAPFEDALLLVH